MLHTICKGLRTRLRGYYIPNISLAFTNCFSACTRASANANACVRSGAEMCVRKCECAKVAHVRVRKNMCNVRARATENPRKLTLCFFRIECEEAQEDQEEDEDPNDLPVQGPLPQEPEDAPWKRNDSGVRRL
jgi:hypothetical protein